MAPNGNNPSHPGAGRRNLLLVGAAGVFLVIWGFVLGIVVGRGSVPTIVPSAGAPVSAPGEPAKPAINNNEGANRKSETNLVVRKEPPSKPAVVDSPPVPAKMPPAPSAKAAPAVEAMPPAQAPPSPAPEPAKTPEPPVTTIITTPPLETPPLAFHNELTAPKPSEPPLTKMAPPAKKKSEPAKEASKAKSAEAGAYTVQVAAIHDRAQAEALAQKLGKQTGQNFQVVTVELPGKGTWHRVRLGGGMSQAAAKEKAQELGKRGLSPVVVKAGP